MSKLNEVKNDLPIITGIILISWFIGAIFFSENESPLNDIIAAWVNYFLGTITVFSIPLPLGFSVTIGIGVTGIVFSYKRPRS